MSERFTPKDEQLDKNEQVRLQNNYRTFELLKLQQDIRAGGGAWYRTLFNHGIDYAKVFNYLTVIPPHERQFRDLIFHIVIYHPFTSFNPLDLPRKITQCVR